MKILAFKYGVPAGSFNGMVKAGVLAHISRSRVSRLIQSGGESKKGYSFDYAIKVGKWNIYLTKRIK